jgi:hypothetical protein
MAAPLTSGGKYQILEKQKQLESAGPGSREGAVETANPEVQEQTPWLKLNLYVMGRTNTPEVKGGKDRFTGAPALLDFGKISLFYFGNSLGIQLRHQKGCSLRIKPHPRVKPTTDTPTMQSNTKLCQGPQRRQNLETDSYQVRDFWRISWVFYKYINKT